MSWRIEHTDEAKADMKALNRSLAMKVEKSLNKVAKNPLPRNEGGYGDPLGHKHGYNLTGLCKIKLKNTGLRVVYKAIRIENVMKIIVIAARADDEVYSIAAKRIGK
ncbi:MAG: type II toxin-antitoxin system RelE/ParE family toxin [Oscillospiraceae bacterium]|nr:type II toxin-antitoxin system RelE/ParE family toxin [Oscillospiraceae bacterium]